MSSGLLQILKLFFEALTEDFLDFCLFLLWDYLGVTFFFVWGVVTQLLKLLEDLVFPWLKSLLKHASFPLLGHWRSRSLRMWDWVQLLLKHLSKPQWLLRLGHGGLISFEAVVKALLNWNALFVVRSIVVIKCLHELRTELAIVFDVFGHLSLYRRKGEDRFRVLCITHIDNSSNIDKIIIGL